MICNVRYFSMLRYSSKGVAYHLLGMPNSDTQEKASLNDPDKANDIVHLAGAQSMRALQAGGKASGACGGLSGRHDTPPIPHEITVWDIANSRQFCWNWFAGRGFRLHPKWDFGFS